MEDTSSQNDDPPGRRGSLQASVRQALNEVTLELSAFQRAVGSRLDLNEADLECFNIVYNKGPLTPSALARRAGLHPATMTGVVDRLERNGWVVRERDPDDRRAVLVRALRPRTRELFVLLSGMNAAMGDILRTYSTDELQVIADFMERTVVAAREAVGELAADA